jgi:hypothetical protein
MRHQVGVQKNGEWNTRNAMIPFQNCQAQGIIHVKVDEALADNIQSLETESIYSTTPDLKILSLLEPGFVIPCISNLTKVESCATIFAIPNCVWILEVC